MFSRFFIDRPIFASVLSIVITLCGAIALYTLPITQYPEITPPTVEVSAIYPGANSRVVSDTVAAPIEQQVNGVEGMMYMSSQCTNDGAYSLTVTFRQGTDLNLAQVLVQNRVALAQPILPGLVQRRGVTVKKKSPSVLMIVNLFSPDRSRDNLYLSNYATIQLRDELSRLPGVGDITFLGQRDYSMRVWLDPQRLASHGLTTEDVVHAIEQQNVQVAAGQIGQPPAPKDQVFQFTMTTLGRLSEDEQFSEMVLKTEADGSLVQLKDVARTELGALGYDQLCTLNSQPSVALSVYQLPGSNALATAQLVRTKMEELKKGFRGGIDYDIVYDTTPFIKESVNEVFHALRDAIILVAIVVLVFLQGWRAAVIPLVAVPVAVVGTFAAMAAFGFSLNTLTLFGLVLAIGIVVDDAIVVVEAIERHIEEGKAPRDAAIHAMDEVAGPVIAVGLVLSAVFIPCVFITGIVGRFFQQFALTIAISTVISAFNSLTLSPALAVLLLRPRHSHAGGSPAAASQGGHAAHPQHEALPRAIVLMIGAWVGYLLGPSIAPQLGDGLKPVFTVISPELLGGIIMIAVAFVGFRVINFLLSGFFSWFNRGFNVVTNIYATIVGVCLRASVVVLLGYVGFIYLTYYLFLISPAGFIPSQDKGYLLVNVQLPDSSSLDRTSRVMQRVEELAASTEGVKHTVGIAGQSIVLGANAPNFATVYLMLEEFHHRPHQTADQIAGDLKIMLEREIPEAMINVFGAPPVDGLGTAGGFKLVIEDRGDNGARALQTASQQLVDDGAATEGLTGLFSSFRADTPWIFIDIDRKAARTRGISLANLFESLQVGFGSLYVNDFNRFGRTWQVNVQSDAQFRMAAKDLKRVLVRSERNELVPLAGVASVREVTGPVMVIRYNLYPSAVVNVNGTAGTSSGQVIDRMNGLSQNVLLPSMSAEWTELALLQLEAGNTAMFAFLLAVVLVFLVLAAQYESWSLPLAVILVVPMCLLCSLIGVYMARMDINIFTQIGFVVLVGLACKNAILIVEFARARCLAGLNRRDATLEACRLRLRPIIMTSFAFILGVVPLMIGSGAGFEMRQTLGVAVFAGMLGVTLFGIFLTPVFFYVIQGLTRTPKPVE
ncbi:efflux RND transporter permease subunit [Schlesneria paludicola]|uniref:efflux RND transporter permease subunit n=1 Tax=Schlesneria paludicola TaxID=360056 RepID=UPI00029A4106|nr:efflux RND transporter permease subunit [Schlesneria paludicola]